MNIKRFEDTDWYKVNRRMVHFSGFHLNGKHLDVLHSYWLQGLFYFGYMLADEKKILKLLKD